MFIGTCFYMDPACDIHVIITCITEKDIQLVLWDGGLSVDCLGGLR